MSFFLWMLEHPHQTLDNRKNGEFYTFKPHNFPHQSF